MRDAELTSVRNKYGYGGPYCTKCGQPTDSVSLICERCCEAQCHVEELGHVTEFLRAHPSSQIEIAHDKRKLLHLVMPRQSKVAWCGLAVTQAKAKRKRIAASPVVECVSFAVDIKGQPVNTALCQSCVQVWEGILL